MQHEAGNERHEIARQIGDLRMDRQMPRKQPVSGGLKRGDEAANQPITQQLAQKWAGSVN